MIIGDTPAQLGQVEAADAMMIDGKIVTREEYRALAAQVEALQRSAVPNEHGKNRYGLDAAYFRNVINRELNRSLMDFKPSELARVFARLSRTADDSVLLENEFIGNHLRQVRADAGRDGFVAGISFERKEGWKRSVIVHWAADRYHASILAGKE